MNTRDDLEAAFQLYWTEMDRCRTAGAYWALLHVAVCLPDICAALLAPRRDPGDRYKAWCADNLDATLLTPKERWNIRCKILHEGRASARASKRYVGFSFGQPSDSGVVDHGRVENGTLHLDVGRLADEIRRGVEHWIAALADPDLQTVGPNLQSLVRVSRAAVPIGLPGADGRYPSVQMLKTN